MIGDKIRVYRIKRGMTQRELAEMVGIDVRTISGYENNKIQPPLYMLKSLCSVLDLEINLSGKAVVFKDTKKDKNEMELTIVQEEKIINGVKFDEKGNIESLDENINLYEKLKDVTLGELPKISNFNISINNDGSNVESMRIDKWFFDDYVLNIGITQKAKNYDGIAKKQICDKVNSLSIPESDGGIEDCYIEDGNVKFYYFVRLDYVDILKISDIYEEIIRITEKVESDLDNDIEWLEKENIKTIKELKDVFLNNGKWTTSLFDLVRSICNKTLTFAVYDDPSKVKILNSCEVGHGSSKRVMLDKITPYGELARKIKDCLRQPDVRMNEFIQCVEDYIEYYKENISLVDIIKEKAEKEGKDINLVLEEVLDKFYEGYESRGKKIIEARVNELKEIGVYDDKAIEVYSENEYRIVNKIIEDVKNLRNDVKLNIQKALKI